MAGFIVIVNSVTDGITYWGALFYKRQPCRSGVSYADKVLVESISRAAKSKETTLAAAIRKKPSATVIDWS